MTKNIIVRISHVIIGCDVVEQNKYDKHEINSKMSSVRNCL